MPDEILQRPGEGRSWWVLGDRLTVKATGAETGGAYALVEIVVLPGRGAPPHRHSREAEAFFVLEGEIAFAVEGREIVAKAGTYLHSPVGQAHHFTNKSQAPARMLVWILPAGFEAFFMAVGRPVADPEEPAPEVTQADIDRVVATAPDYGVELLPPPGG